MPKFLMAKLDRAQSGLTEMREALDGLSKSVGSKWVKEWERKEKEAFTEGGIGAQLVIGWDDLLIISPTFPSFANTLHYTMLILTSSRYYDYATHHAYPFLTLNNSIYHSRLHFDFILLLPHISHQYLFQHSIH